MKCESTPVWVECMEYEKFKESTTVCKLDIYKLEAKPGRLFFTGEKLLCKRFMSKHIIQVHLESEGKQEGLRKTKRPKIFLRTEDVNQLASTLLQSENLPKNVVRSKLKGILKDINW